MSATRHRGQPLAMLGLVLAGWIGLRAAVWEPPFALPGLVEAPRLAERVQTAIRPMATRAMPSEQAGAVASFALPGTSSTRPTEVPRSAVSGSLPALAKPGLPLAGGVREPLPFERELAPVPSRALASLPATAPHIAAAHQLLYLAALARLPLPPGLALAIVPAQPVPAPVSPLTSWAAASTAPRWSGDGWVLVRRGQRLSAGGLAAASGFPSYGASQAGGVVRFALAPGSARAPQAYVRVSRALGGFDEGEVAAGLSARPFASVPLRLLGEARVQRGSGGTRVRPAVSLVSELPPLRLPLGIAGEAYAQAGYAGAPVGARRGATPFFDVQAVADRRLASAGPAELRLGAAAWSGGQEGAARLDLGPRASVRLDLGATRSRLALDWRFRVAGNARPASGPTVTFSAGF